MVTNSKLTLLLVNFMHFTKHNIYKEYILINLISDIVLRDNSLKPVLQSTNCHLKDLLNTQMAKFILFGVIGMCSIHFMQFFFWSSKTGKKQAENLVFSDISIIIQSFHHQTSTVCRIFCVQSEILFVWQSDN